MRTRVPEDPPPHRSQKDQRAADRRAETFKTFSGTLRFSNFTRPRTRRQFVHTVTRLGRRWYKIERDLLYHPEITRLIHRLAQSVLADLRVFDAREGRLTEAAYYDTLDMILRWSPSDSNFDAYTSHRHILEPGQAKVPCTRCLILLKQPAYIFWANGAEHSHAIGVHCLAQMLDELDRVCRLWEWNANMRPVDYTGIPYSERFEQHRRRGPDPDAEC